MITWGPMIHLMGLFHFAQKRQGGIMKENQTFNEKPFNKQEDYNGCYTTESLAIRLNVSKKFIVSHRRSISGAMKIGRIWRFDKAVVEKKLLSGALF